MIITVPVVRSLVFPLFTCFMVVLPVCRSICFSTCSQKKGMRITQNMWKMHQARMHQAYKIASRTAEKETARSKQGYDRRIHGATLQPGGRVLVRNLSEGGGPGKL